MFCFKNFFKNNLLLSFTVAFSQVQDIIYSKLVLSFSSFQVLTHSCMVSKKEKHFVTNYSSFMFVWVFFFMCLITRQNSSVIADTASGASHVSFNKDPGWKWPLIWVSFILTMQLKVEKAGAEHKVAQTGKTNRIKLKTEMQGDSGKQRRKTQGNTQQRTRKKHRA